MADREVAIVGDLIKYTYTVENTGTIALNSLTLNDDKLGIVVLNDPDPLDPGESRTYYAILHSEKWRWANIEEYSCGHCIRS